MFGGVAVIVSRFAEKNVEWLVQDSLVVKKDSDVVRAWQHPEFPILMKFYIFNVTNADEIEKGGKPVLTEHGPYVYKMTSPRFDIEFYPNDTVTFRNNNTLHFDASLSAGYETDTFNHINFPVVVMAESLKSSFDWIKRMGLYDKFLSFVGKENLVESHTVHEIIFGYDDPMLEELSAFWSLFGEKFDPTFGPFHGFNNSDDGLFLVDTGEADFKNYGAIQRWNGDASLSCWSDKYANMINGTDGSFLLPGVKSNESRYVYLPQMLRSVKLTYEKATSFKGIDTYRYHFADDLLKSGSVVPENKGFCVPKGNCFDSGLLNVGSCGSKTVPIFLSLPHFYQGSPGLVNNITGMKPNKTLHDSFFHVEPTTGAVVVGQRRLQINVHVTRNEALRQMKDVRSVFFPYLWLSGEAVVDDGTASKLHRALILITASAYTGYLILLIGVIIMVVAQIKKYKRIGVIRTEPVAEDEERLVPSTSSAAVDA